MELSVGAVESTALEFNVQSCEGLHADQVMEDTSRVGVMGAIVKLGDSARRILEIFVPVTRNQENGKKTVCDSFHPLGQGTTFTHA